MDAQDLVALACETRRRIERLLSGHRSPSDPEIQNWAFGEIYRITEPDDPELKPLFDVLDRILNLCLMFENGPWDPDPREFRKLLDEMEDHLSHMRV